MRQTTVLIARLSTAAGARSPLGHITDQIFSGIVNELNHQGVSNKVIADMFGMALRSYRQKVQRLAEADTPRGATLRGSVQAFLSGREWSTRAEVMERFKHEDDVSVRSILRDLVESGLVIRSGMRDDTRYRAATEDELRDLGTRPIGEGPGWQALLEHHGAVLNAIAAKVTSGSRSSAPADEAGETTLTFHLWPGHPKEREVRQLLAQIRAAALPLWEDANRLSASESRAGAYLIHLYLGQHVGADDDLPRVASVTSETQH